MAIFYNHIKGCGSKTVGNGKQYDLWTWIKWADNDTQADTITADEEWLPSIWLNKTNLTSGEPGINAGKIITYKASSQYIEKPFRFKERIWINSQKEICWNDDPNTYIVGNANGLTLRGQAIVLNLKSTTKTITVDKDKINIFDIGYFYHTTNTTEQYHFNLEGQAKIKNCLYVGADADNKFNPKTATVGTIKAEHKCEALYFNATSDRRAKSNITPAQFSALSVVNNLPIYTFQYLNLEEPVIGLIAQEAAEYNLNGFNMVDNLDASGEFGDFMQMKESKLVYVLWKAVQELSAEVEDLKAEIRNLK